MVKGKLSTRHSALREGTLLVGVLLAVSLSIATFPYIVAIESPQIQPVTLSGTLGEEVLNPACRTSVPPCASPSLVLPILLIQNGTIYALTSDNLTLKQQLLTENGLFVTVTGLLQPFNASISNLTFTCTPYPCGAIAAQISVISLEQVTNTTTTDQTSATVDQTSTTSTQAVPGFEISSILLGLALGIVVVARRRKARK